MAGPGVKVEGLKEFVKDLEALAEHLPEAMAEGQRQIADEVATAARGRAASAYISSRAAATLQAAKGSKTAAVMVGSAGVPWALGNEFGGIIHRQFKPWLGSGPGSGYALYPAIREEAESGRLVERYGQLVDKVARKAFPN